MGGTSSIDQRFLTIVKKEYEDLKQQSLSEDEIYKALSTSFFNADGTMKDRNIDADADAARREEEEKRKERSKHTIMISLHVASMEIHSFA